jgi:hypothetical protein
MLCRGTQKGGGAGVGAIFCECEIILYRYATVTNYVLNIMLDITNCWQVIFIVDAPGRLLYVKL